MLRPQKRDRPLANETSEKIARRCFFGAPRSNAGAGFRAKFFPHKNFARPETFFFGQIFRMSTRRHKFTFSLVKHCRFVRLSERPFSESFLAALRPAHPPSSCFQEACSTNAAASASFFQDFQNRNTRATRLHVALVSITSEAKAPRGHAPFAVDPLVVLRIVDRSMY